MSSIFWGLRLEPGKRYSTIVDKSFHVSKAALDCSSVKNENEIVSVMLEEGESRTSFILCNLQKSKELHSDLDLNFMSGDQVTFFCKGSGVVHLSGYVIMDDEDELGGLGDEEVEDEEDEDAEDDVEEENQLNGTGQKRKKGSSLNLNNKKAKVGDDEDDDTDEEDNDDSFDFSNLGGSDDDEDEEDSDEDEDDDDDSDEEDEEEDDEEEEAPKQQLNQKQKNKGKNQLPTLASKPATPVGDKQKTPKGQQKTPNQQQQQLSGKKDKKKGDTPKQLNKSSSEDSTTPQKFKPTTVQGGVVVKDIKLGNGPVCKNGKMVSVYYTGRLKNNNKVFDSTTQGSGFQFRLGKGEVIKGWDVGLQGMKVGGKRLITCPPPMAYGQKGSPPTIPGNSTLMFEVELRGVN